jgi:diguanylate cyclase (GGDEF)-like protein/hemerythrin-like metal-binding protein/PAS domain S-box-containing protein
MDAEHQRLIELINRVGRLGHANAGGLHDALRELRDYTVYHFRTEAQLMQRYPLDAGFVRSHLAAHAGFVQRLDEFDALVASDPGAVVECLMAFMVKWLVHHVTRVDARLARDIAECEGGTGRGPPADVEGERFDALIDTVSDLYEGMAERTIQLLRANQQLQAEIFRRQQAEQDLRISAIVFDAVDEAVMVTSAENRIIRVNSAFSRITGFAADEAIGANPRIMSSATHPPEFYRELWSAVVNTGKWQGEIRNRRKNGELYVEWLSIYRVRDDSNGEIRHVAVFSDITKQRVEAERIQYLANYDLLTGLPNRTLLIDRLRQELASASANSGRLALMFIDLDWFKAVNDGLGHDVGDLLLKLAAQRMNDCVSAADTVARHGGDEFVVLLPCIVDSAAAVDIAHRLRIALCQPFDLRGHRASISCSIGVALFPEHGADELQLLKSADTAMYRAKVNGRNGVCCQDLSTS